MNIIWCLKCVCVWPQILEEKRQCVCVYVHNQMYLTKIVVDNVKIVKRHKWYTHTSTVIKLVGKQNLQANDERKNEHRTSNNYIPETTTTKKHQHNRKKMFSCLKKEKKYMKTYNLLNDFPCTTHKVNHVCVCVCQT